MGKERILQNIQKAHRIIYEYNKFVRNLDLKLQKEIGSNRNIHKYPRIDHEYEYYYPTFIEFFFGERETNKIPKGCYSALIVTDTSLIEEDSEQQSFLILLYESPKNKIQEEIYKILQNSNFTEKQSSFANIIKSASNSNEPSIDEPSIDDKNFTWKAIKLLDILEDPNNLKNECRNFFNEISKLK